jgi:hypothetical protein
MARGELGEGDGAVGAGLGTIGAGNGAAIVGPEVGGVVADRWLAAALGLPPTASATHLDPPLAGVVPDPVVGVPSTAPADGSARAPASVTTGRATGGTTDGGIWWIVSDASDEMFAVAVDVDVDVVVAGTSETVDLSTPASGALPVTVWTVGNDGGSGSALAPAG